MIHFASLVAVLGEVPDPGACVAALHSVLRPGALLSVSEVLPTRGGFTANYRRV